MSKRQYNFIFSKLVRKPDDLLGLLAYCIYKNEKIEYIKNFEKDHNGKSPSEKELSLFHEMQSSQPSINKYMELANSRMSNVLSQILQDNLDIYKKTQKKAYAEALADLKPTFRSRALDGIIGNACFLVVTFVFILFSKLFQSDPAGQLIKWLVSLFF